MFSFADEVASIDMQDVDQVNVHQPDLTFILVYAVLENRIFILVYVILELWERT